MGEITTDRAVSAALYEEAKGYFPGGVSSPVRAFRSVDGPPLFMVKGAGPRIHDADGNSYLDFCCSYGPLILGHAHPAIVDSVAKTAANGLSFGAPSRQENELAKLIIENNQFVEKIRFVNSGTEAVMSAIRLARGATGRNKIVKFEGCYHGHVDSMLVKAGSGLVTLGTSTSAGIPEAYVNETIVVPLNDEAAIEKAVVDYKDDIACIVIEPIPANNGLLLQDLSFLKFLRTICDREGILLFFDEVISGFRVGFEGAAGLYGIHPDIVTYGKIIGGGMPVGAYGASAALMSNIAPDGPVYQAGTLSGNPVAMAAGAAQLTECLKPGFYENLEQKTKQFVGTILAHSQEKGYSFRMFSVGSIFWMAFSDLEAIRRSDQIDPQSMDLFKHMYGALLKRGIYLGPSGYEVGFVSHAHSEADLEKAATAFCESLDSVLGHA